MINTTKRRLLEGQSALGATVGLGSPLAAELLARAAFDFVMVDGQHSNWNDETAWPAFRGIVLGGSIPMARVQQNDFYAIGRLLDRGSFGIIVPMVNSVAGAEAEAAAHAVRYPPTADARGGHP